MQKNLQLAKKQTPIKVVVNNPTSLEGAQHDGSNKSLSRHNSFNKDDNTNSTSSDSNNNVDFIGPSNAVKSLFSLPYNTDTNVSVALHNMGNGTILLDSAQDFGNGENASSVGTNSTPGGGRRGRRRQRPASWANSIREEQELAAAENDGYEDEVNQLQLVQKQREGEKSILASLSLLLEEEKKGISDKPPFESSALIVPSEKAIVIKEQGGEPIITTDTMSTNNNNNTDTNDDGLHHPPQHYMSHAVTPPAEPRQYVDWKFKNDLKLLVASDAVIYNNHGGDGINKGESVTIRVADTAELQAQMKYHENMTKEGTLLAQEEEDLHALPPSSYAEALISPSTEEYETEYEDENSLNRLQTCIIPSTGGDLANLGFFQSSVCPPPDSSRGKDECADASSSALPYSSTPVCTVLDTYLDNLMANVPQLALILREKGFVQNIKLLRTEDIPSLMMHPSTIGVDEAVKDNDPPQIFSPDIVEMNAAMLLRFLKSNCSKDNSTYLLHRAAGETNIQLFDISSISELRQKKWVWWLALCSYRFACRLENLQRAMSSHDKVTRREYRSRQRHLLHNTLNLLEELVDMDGAKHDTICAAVYEHLADTFLWDDDDTQGVGISDTGKPKPCVSSSQPYVNVTVDCLNKAHDHLMDGIKKLTPLLVKAKRDKSSMEMEAISTQMLGIHYKIINVNLRLADHHLQNYFSSNLIQALRTAGRMLSDASSLLEVLNSQTNNNDESNLYARSIVLQYAWLWEYCGHFARSFAADELWRDRGHTSGEDLISLFREVYTSCGSIMRQPCIGGPKWKPTKSSIVAASHGQVSLNSLSGIVILPTDFEEITASVLQKEGAHEAIAACKKILDQKSQIKRETVLNLVAASVSYGHALDAFVFLDGQVCGEEVEVDILTSHKRKESNEGLLMDVTIAPLVRQRLGDACNEIGKVLLDESRAVLLPQFSPPEGIGVSNKNFGLSHVSAIMLASAQFWFERGLEQFTEGGDLRNLALLRCNLCQCCKIRANTNVMLPGTSPEDSRKKDNEAYLQDAVDHLVAAHEAMGQRDTDPVTWDMVSEELAATLLVLGVRRRQAALSSSSALLLQALRLTPGVEKGIIEPMEKSCQIYESLGTAKASHQAACAHYQLALYFSKVWTCQRDEVKTREKLAAAFKHYGQAHQYFFQHILGNEITFIVLSLDFASLYSAVSGEECLSKALLCCLDTRAAFSVEVGASAKEQMKILEESVEERVTKLLLSLVKMEKEKSKPSDKYKEMYRKVLGYKMTAPKKDDNNQDESSADDPYRIFTLLKELQELSISRV